MVGKLSDLPSYDVLLVDTMNVAMSQFYFRSNFQYQGYATGMLYGVVKEIRRLQRLYPSAKVMFLWEGFNSIRKEYFPDYKANRVKREPIPGLNQSLNDLKVAIPLLGGWQVTHRQLEADDLAAYYSKQFNSALLLSNDTDWWQFLRPGEVDVEYKGELNTWERLEAQLGYRPDRTAIAKIIRGDSGDNIRAGLPRLPKALLMEVLHECDSYEQIYTCSALPPKWKALADSNRERLEKNAFLINSHESTVLEKDLSVVEPARDAPKLSALLEARGFPSFAHRV